MLFRSGDNYANPQLTGENSDRVAVLDCHFYKACKDGTEGAAIALRGMDNTVISGCMIRGGGLASLGIQFQNSRDVLATGNELSEFTGNGEGIKLDKLGTTMFANSGRFEYNRIVNATEGIDVDDQVWHTTVLGNVISGCTDEGISVDDSATAVLIGNKVRGCTDGILVEAGAVVIMASNSSYDNSSNNYRILNGYALPGSNVTFAPPIAVDAEYYPANPASWVGPSPADMSDAIDRLAAALGPIP